MRQKKSSFESDSPALTDCVDASIITLQQAETYFGIFFRGCDHYVPVFDPGHDTLTSIRTRSSLLFCAICAVGCRIVAGADTQHWRLLDFHLKRMLNCVLATPSLACLETVQALLVRSCYASERSLLVAAATRMACDLGFPDAYDQLVSRSVSSRERERSSAMAASGPGICTRGDGDESSAVLMRRARTWLHLFVLGHIHHVDAADLTTFRFVGDARRSRILLKSALSTELDLFLLSQVELNVIRARIYDSLSSDLSRSDDSEEAMTALVREARIDIDVWFDDWAHMFEKHAAQSPWLLVNLRVQKCWAENMAMCAAVRVSGVEDVDVMTPFQRELLFIARDALEEHLSIMVEEPRIYLRNLRFAMDFVWAKCTFCYLLLVKLSLLLPSSGTSCRGRSSQELIDHGNTLLAELRDVGGGEGESSAGGYQSNTSRLYIQLLKTGIERFANTLTTKKDQGHDMSCASKRAPSSLPADSAAASAAAAAAAAAAANDDGQGQIQGGGLESFVPEQFVFEWDFPGLTLFSSGIGMAWLDDILLGTLNGGDDFLAWGPIGILSE
ncbi:hypothetical protein ESCO_005833 [Escovopsis weberi]|uniref:Transcription factor domain-containing protein n=1 Tax=Escovopsis weberi TaxID=150374 RepID=A0A0M8MYU3_ESCWE|nr:hypothetical protein ESCO_005833 [Escovopsis weberi]